MNKRSTVNKIVLSGVLVAIATIFGAFSIPVFGGKMSPVQHFINVVSAVTLGPIYALGNAFIASLLRNIMGTGSLLAFPGSMIGALLAGIIYKKVHKVGGAVIGEIIGTGFLGALAAYPISRLLLNNDVAAFIYIVPFSISCIGGSIIGYIFLKIPVIRNFLIQKEE